MSLCCSSLSFIIHVHYQHLLTLIHVDDCFTTSLLNIGFSAPFTLSVSSTTHSLSVSTYTPPVSIRGQTIASHSLFPFIFPSVFIFHSPLLELPLIGIIFSFFLRGVVLSLSQLHGTVSTSSPLARTAVKYYLFNCWWRYPPTDVLKSDCGKFEIYTSCAMFQPQWRRSPRSLLS